MGTYALVCQGKVLCRYETETAAKKAAFEHNMSNDEVSYWCRVVWLPEPKKEPPQP